MQGKRGERGCIGDMRIQETKERRKGSEIGRSARLYLCPSRSQAPLQCNRF
jgi:hypothetical protein